ncbi:MAG: Uncharacterized pterin binding enzyme, partial [uncultured Nocardioides sp.]
KVRRSRHRAAQRRRRDPHGGGEAHRAHAQDHRGRDAGVRHSGGRHRHRPAGHADRRRPGGRQHHAGDDASDPRGVRRQHDLRGLQRLLRHAVAAQPRRGVPADGHDRRSHLGHHGHPHAPDSRVGQGRRPAARPRRVGQRLDRGPPRPTGEGSRSGLV